MRRREFLLAAGTAGSGGVAWYASRDPRETLEARTWFTARAAAHDGLAERVREYLQAGLAPACESVEYSHGGVVSVGAEHGRDLMAIEWPRLVGQGLVGLGPVDPVRDVNLLVTDGDPRRDPAGYGMSNVATVTGAGHLAGAPPRETVDDAVPASTGGAVAQLLLHETGHALGLAHDHGTVSVRGDVAVASPMLGGYAWSAGADDPSGAAGGCGGAGPDGAEERRLGLSYSQCSRAAIRSYSGGVVP